MLLMDRDHIMSSTQSTITDENIQEILKKSEEKSRKLDEKVKNSEINFENFDTIYNYEGNDYQHKQEHKSLFSSGLSTRSRRTYNVVEVISSDDENDEVFTTSVKVKQEPEDFNYERPRLYEFQFHDPRLQELLDQEYFHFLKRKHNERTKKILEEMLPRDRKQVENAKSLTVANLLKKRQYLESGKFF